jgi:hypothetical protein
MSEKSFRARHGVSVGDAVPIDVIDVNGAVTSTGGSINNSTIGATTPNTGKFTTLWATGNTTLNGTLVVDGQTEFKDHSIEINKITSPTDANANGGGIVLKGTSDHSLTWNNSTTAWDINDNLNIPAGKVYRINGTQILSNTTLGSSVVSSSLTSVGTIGTGTWAGTPVGVSFGGTGGTSSGAALTNLLPTGQQNGYFLRSDAVGSYYWAAPGSVAASGSTIQISRLPPQVATGGQTVFNAPTYVIGSNQLKIFVNGVRQYLGAEESYTETSTSTFTFTEGLVAGDVVLAEVDGYTTWTLSANNIANSPAGDIAAVDVQAAINELDSEKAPKVSPTFTGTLTVPTIVGQASAAGSITIKGNSADNAGSVSLTGSTINLGIASQNTTVNLNGNGATGTATLATNVTGAGIVNVLNEVTTGSVRIGDGVTTGTIRIGALGVGAKTIQIGTTTGTTTVTGIVQLPTVGTSGFVKLGASGGLSAGSFGTGVETFLATPTSANLAAAVTNETGTGALVFATSPTLVTPILGTPSSGTLTSCTGLPAAGVVGTALTQAATVTAAQGGTGQATYDIGDIIYASGATALSKLADVATGNALISGGVGVAPAWGKVALTTHVSGILPVANGGTGATTLTSGGLLVGNGTSAVGIASAAQIVAAISTTAVTNATNATNVTGTTAAAIPVTALGSGTADSTTFLRGDRTFQTIAAPTIASTAEAQAGTNNTNFLTPLRLREGFNASGSAPVYACRAWVNFNGTGVVAIRASGNVSSITDNGVGDYTVNFTTAMPDVDYSAVGGANNGGTIGGWYVLTPFVYSVGSVRVGTTAAAGSTDNSLISVSVFR